MKSLFLSSLACAALVLGTAHAHGGTYRGPEDVVPPNPGGGGKPGSGRGNGPSTPGPGGPSIPGAGPSTPGPTGPVSGGAGGTTPRGPATPRLVLEPDLTTWQYWWEFNKDPFIRLKEAVQAGSTTSGGDDIYFGESKRADAKDVMRPTAVEKQEILPALKRAMDSTSNRDITSACMVAMAKIGIDHEDFRILPVFREQLRSRDQEIRETAALAIGIAQMETAIGELLIPLVEDNAAARSLLGNHEVDVRTRSFAAYALGLVAWATPALDAKRKSLTALQALLADERITDRNLRVAAINGIRLLRPDAAKGDAERQLRDDCLTTLWTCYQQKSGQGAQLIQAHVPPAIAQLLGRGGDRSGQFKDAFAAELAGGTKRADHIYQSAVLALGQLCLAKEVEPADARYSQAIQKYYATGMEQQAHNFCLIALAQIGGASNREFLLEALRRGKQAIEKPWAALALGVYAFHQHQAGGANASTDAAIATALQAEFREARNTDTLGALAIALGLAHARDAEADLLERLSKTRHQEELAGHLCIGLALMGAQGSLEDIRNIVQTSERRPELLKHAAIAMGKLGDKRVATMLQAALTDGDQNLAKLSAIAAALGCIGDRRSIEPLKKMLFDESLTMLSRAFAAVALGGIADKELLPWNSKIGVGMNYRAAVETLTNRASGILDIL